MTAAKTDTVEISAAELEELRARAVAAEAEAERYRPFKDVSDRMYSTPEEVIAHFGEKYMRELAGSELADINKVRLRQGLDRVHYSDEEWEQAIQAKAAEMVQDRRKWVKTDGGARRTLKMVKPSGGVVQIPVEDQINNQAGSLQDGIGRYKDKGFKLATDANGAMLCAMEDCWEVALVEHGQPTHGGYCSASHRAMTEPRKVNGVDNVITAGALRG